MKTNSTHNSIYHPLFLDFILNQPGLLSSPTPSSIAKNQVDSFGIVLLVDRFGSLLTEKCALDALADKSTWYSSFMFQEGLTYWWIFVK